MQGTEALDRLVPVKVRQVLPKQQTYISPDTITLMQTRDTTTAKVRITRYPNDLRLVRSLRNQVTRTEEDKKEVLNRVYDQSKTSSKDL